MNNDYEGYDNTDEENEEIQELITDFKSMIDRSENRYFDSDDMIDIIETLIEQFDFKYAEAAIHYSEENHPDSYECKLLKSRFFIMTMNVPAAKKLLDEIERDYSPTADFYLQKTLYCKLIGQNKDTIHLLRKAYQLEPENTGINFMLGNELLILDKYEEALPYIAYAIQNDTEYEEQLFTISYIFEEKKDKQLAVDFFLTLTNKFPLSKAGWFGLGLAYNWTKQHEKAIDAYLNAISLADNGSSAYYNIANTYFELKEFEKALENYQIAYSLDNRDYHAISSIADCYTELQDFEKALDFYHQALEIAPDNTETNLGIIHTLKTMGREEDARAFLDNLFRNQPDNFDLFFGLITYFEDENRREMRIRDFVQNHIKSLDNKEEFLRLLTIFCCTTEQCIDIAINILEEYLDDEEVTFTIPYLLAALHFLKKEDEKAENYLKTALLINYDEYKLFLALHPSFEFNPTIQHLIQLYNNSAS